MNLKSYFAMSPRLILLSLTPLLLTLAWLANELIAGFTRVSFSPYLLLVLIVTPFFVYYLVRRHNPEEALKAGLLTPCYLTPLSVLSSWTIAPGVAGFASFGGFGYFVEGLTKHPNFGPINLEVLLGILCVFGSAILPVAIAIYVLGIKPHKQKKWFFCLLCVFFLLFYVPVLLRLDYNIFQESLRGLRFLPSLAVLGAATGAIYRLVSALCIYLLFRTVGKD